MLIRTMMLALTMAGAAPAQAAFDSISTRACVAPERTGTFRVVATRTGGNAGVLAVLLLENIDGCLEATFVTDDRGPAVIDHLSLSANTLKGRINVTGEPAAFMVRFEDTRVAGSIVAKKQEWRLEGRKTS